jgi:hypothetical protein
MFLESSSARVQMGCRILLLLHMETPRNPRNISKQIVYVSDEDCQEHIYLPI